MDLKYISIEILKKKIEQQEKKLEKQKYATPRVYEGGYLKALKDLLELCEKE